MLKGDFYIDLCYISCEWVTAGLTMSLDFWHFISHFSLNNGIESKFSYKSKLFLANGRNRTWFFDQPNSKLWIFANKRVSYIKNAKWFTLLKLNKIVRFSTSLTISSRKHGPRSYWKNVFGHHSDKVLILFINLTCSISSLRSRFRINHLDL